MKMCGWCEITSVNKIRISACAFTAIDDHPIEDECVYNMSVQNDASHSFKVAFLVQKKKAMHALGFSIVMRCKGVLRSSLVLENYFLSTSF